MILHFLDLVLLRVTLQLYCLHSFCSLLAKTDTSNGVILTDIPDRARYVYLTDNRIATIATGAFFNLSLCAGLYLDYNEISEIRQGMFDG